MGLKPPEPGGTPYPLAKANGNGYGLLPLSIAVCFS